jgi:membrane-bound lytic murein transglycosylase D
MTFRRRHFWAVLLGLGALPARAQEVMSIDDAVNLGAEFLRHNLDDDALAALNQLDLAPARQFLEQLQRELNADYVIDLAELRQTARQIAPLLDQYEETAPYADWLRTRLDYLDAAEQFKKLIPPPKPRPGQPPPRRPNPTPEQELKIWRTIIAPRPVPKAAEPYVKKLKPVFAAQGLPEGLVWLAEVESGWHPRAKSPVGAAGLYQLMPTTARSLGLSTRLRDERLDPEKSGRAAARYLKYLYSRFKDWALALAAYNLGEGRLRAIMKRHQAKTFAAVSTHLPAETQMYVPKFEAILLKREGVRLAQLAPPK